MQAKAQETARKTQARTSGSSRARQALNKAKEIPGVGGKRGQTASQRGPCLLPPANWGPAAGAADGLGKGRGPKSGDALPADMERETGAALRMSLASRDAQRSRVRHGIRGQGASSLAPALAPDSRRGWCLERGCCADPP